MGFGDYRNYNLTLLIINNSCLSLMIMAKVILVLIVYALKLLYV